MTTHIHIKTNVIRDASDVTKTINVVLEKHSNTSELIGTYINDDGDEITHKYDGYEDATIIDTRSFVFTIPEDQQTNLVVGTHPHNTENELAYQEKYLLWWAGIKQSESFQTNHLELVTGE